MINTYTKPVIGYASFGYSKHIALQKLGATLLRKYGIEVLEEHMQYNKDTREWIVTYDTETHAPLYPLATNEPKG